jgi:hypothetical protein
LQVSYKDGTKIDLNWYDFDSVALDGTEVMDALKNRYVGQSGRIFPKRNAANAGRLGLTRQLCPRLWAAHEEADEIGAQDTLGIMTLSLHAVMFVLTVPTGGTGSSPCRRSGG